MAINIHIKTKNIDLTPAINADVHEKLQGIEKFIAPTGDQEILAEVELGLVSKHHHKGAIYRVEVNVSTNGKMYRSDAEADTLTAALDEVKDDIVTVINRREEKQSDMFRKGSRMIKKLLTGK